MSKIEVDAITQQSGSTLTVGGGASKTVVADATTVTLGRCGGTVALASGASQTGFGRTGTVDWQTTIKTSDFTAANGEGYFINTTSGGVTMTLPSSPSAGNIVSVKDYAYKFGTNALTVNRNGSPIGGGSDFNPTYSTDGAFLTFIYADATKGWLLTDESNNTTDVSSTFISATGGTIKTCGDFKTHIFTGPGTFCVSAGTGPVAVADYFVIAGGGSGATGCAGGGGGAGGFRVSNCVGSIPAPTMSPLVKACGALPISVQAYPITVGAGGTAVTGGPGTPSPSGNNGNNSSFSTITSTGGGAGGAGNPTGTPSPSPATNNSGKPGGSGGGGGHAGGVAGVGNTPPVSPVQGTNGGASQPVSDDRGGGGGGAGDVGSAGNPNKGGCGSFVADAFIGGCAPSYGFPAPSSTRIFAGGGGGGSRNNPGSESGGAGGPGGGGAGGANANGTNATANTGSGGGGASQPGSPARTSGAGGSGIVMIRYKFQ